MVITAYVVPVLALLATPLIFWSLVSNAGEPAGMVGIARYLVVSSPLDAIRIVSLLSLSVGLLNILPIFPFDGGRICAQIVKRAIGLRAQSAFQATGLVLASLVLLYSFGSDIFWLAT